MTSELLRYIDNPRSAQANYQLAERFFDEGQIAGAVSHFLRCAEYGNCNQDSKLIYASLLRLSQCFARLCYRKQSESGWLFQAISFMPDQPEAYWMLSRFYEWRKEWEESYSFAQIGISKLPENKPFVGEIGFDGEFVLHFQKAVAAWWCGRTEESREIIFSLPDQYVLSPQYREAVQRNMLTIGAGGGVENSFRYHKGLFDGHLFKGFESICMNYSQVYQDLFVLAMLEGKRHGYFLEIGAGDPVLNNNSYLLESQFQWGGLSLEIKESEVAKWKGKRKTHIVCRDATAVNYSKLLSGLNAPADIDYLQIDCEPSETSYRVLLNIPFEQYRFAVITFEHDHYADASRLIRSRSREYLTAMGYVLAVNDISANGKHSFEDWWVNPDLVSAEKIGQMQLLGNEVNHAEAYMKSRITTCKTTR